MLLSLAAAATVAEGPAGTSTVVVTPRARLHLILYSRGALVKIRVELGVSGGKEGKHVTTLHRLSFEEAHCGTLSSR